MKGEKEIASHDIVIDPILKCWQEISFRHCVGENHDGGILLT